MNKEITEKIKRLRINKGISQAEMAEKLNITRSAYHNIESGESFSWAKYLNEIISVFETTPKDFFSDIGQKIINQNNYEGSFGYVVEHLHQENREVYEKLLAAKDEQIALLKNLLEKTGL
ncbi:MAG: helix-turn-helix domain-containing protein [Dysgonamonadaceae bacterium]|jgi:transcriptional regulator with XRE-family HTH domain|nr:helix-turn-helix domain-containing protein [Dysgonamonadaceae bacterium]